MKEWFMKCPFCANEIKEWATKCQYCEEFIWVTNQKKSIESKNKNKFFLKNNFAFNNKFTLYFIIWVLLIIICVLLFFLLKQWDKWDKITKNNKTEMTITQDDVLQFDMDKKCKDEYLDEYIYTRNSNWFTIESVFSEKWQWDHNHSADTYYYDIFYSPVEKECIFAFKREYIACDSIHICKSDKDLWSNDYSELEYRIEEAKRIWNENKKYMFEHFYYTKWNPTIDDMRRWEKTANVSDVIWWFFGFMNEQRNIFDKELNRLKGK